MKEEAFDWDSLLTEEERKRRREQFERELWEATDIFAKTPHGKAMIAELLAMMRVEQETANDECPSVNH